MLTVHRSNRLEELLRALASRVARPSRTPFHRQTIVVSSSGMERFVSLRLADALGIWANAEFPFPRAFVERVLAAVVPQGSDGSVRFTRDSLRWAIAATLPQLLDRPELVPVRGYLDAESGASKLLGLSAKIADVFDQYAVFRPDLVLDWERGGGEGWQPVLWRVLVERLGSGHLAARAERFFERFPELEELPAGLPERVDVFGVSSLPPVYLKILAALSRRLDVDLYLLCPSEATWNRLRDKRTELRNLLGRSGGVLDVQAAERVEGELGGLAGSLGRVERELQHVLEISTDYRDGHAVFVDPGNATLLSALQSSVLHARPTFSCTSSPSLDRSVGVHSCHGPMREVEVLRDQLLGLMHDDASIHPHDVVVMVPDIEAYAPYIHAVFGLEASEPGFLPYRIADRTQRSASAVAEATLESLRVLGGRLTASDVLDLLQLEPIRARSGIGVMDLPRVERWVADVGVRWGVDGAHRREVGQPAFEENTWRFGMTRLLLGVALPGRDSALFEGALPYDHVEGEAAQLAGKLAELCEKLAAWREQLAPPRSLRDWRDDIAAAMSDLLEVPENDAWQLRVVRETLEGLATAAQHAGFEASISQKEMLRVLEEALESERASHEFLSGGITFCALLPMRSIPFRVVCLMGMNDGDFPRLSRSLAFDEMSRAPRVGDRRVRDEDRHLFLESLLSARQHLLITFAGRGIQDDGVRPPSVVVGELLDALTDARAVEPPASTSAQPRQLSLFDPPVRAPELRAQRAGGTPGTRPTSLVTSHPLQAYSERYFDGSRDPELFSFQTLELRGALAKVGERREPRGLFPQPLASELPSDVELDELIAFFEHPARYLLERRVGLVLRERRETLSAREPMELAPLERHAVGSFLFARCLAGLDDEAAYQLVRAAGLLPHGGLGKVACAEILTEARALAQATQLWRQGPRARPVPLQIELAEGLLVGSLSEVWPRAQVHSTFSRAKAKTELGLWIRHLALQLSSDTGAPRSSVLVSRAKSGSGVAVRELSPIPADAARGHLSALCSIWRSGQLRPLPLFPEASLTYAETFLRLGATPEARQRAVELARGVFDGRSRAHSESDDVYVQRAFAQADPITGDSADLGGAGFGELALSVFEPLISARVAGES